MSRHTSEDGDEEFSRLLKEKLATVRPDPSPFIKTTEPGTALTAEMIRKAIDKVMNEPYRICPPNDFHVVHPEALKRGGIAMCANCFQPVCVGDVVYPEHQIFLAHE